MHNFLNNQKGKIPFKMVILGLAVIVVLVTSRIFILRNQENKNTQKQLLNIQIPINYSQPLIIAIFNNTLSIQPVNAQSSNKIIETRHALSLPGGMQEVIKYINAYKNTDVLQTKYTNKLKEDIILKQAGHPDKFEYEINIQDYIWQIEQNGDILFRQKQKQEPYSVPSTDGSIISAEIMSQYLDEHPKVFRIPAPFMVEMRHCLVSTGECGNSKDRGNVEVEINGNILTLIPDKKWINNHDYPIVVDPTIEFLPYGQFVQEIAKDRTYTSRNFLNEDGSYTIMAHIGQVNYKDDNEQYQIVDTSLIDQGTYWEQAKASYNSKVSKYADEWLEFRDIYDGKDQTVRMKANVKTKTQGQLITDINEPWHDKKVVYKDAFGTGYDLETIVGNVMFQKLIKINSKPKDLSQNLEFEFEIELPTEAKVYAQQTEWDKISSLQTNKQIKIGTGQVGKEGFSYLREFRAWDSGDPINRKKISINVELYKKDNKLYFKKIIPKDFLATAVYPVYTDASISPYTDAGGDGTAYEYATTFALARAGAGDGHGDTATEDNPARTSYYNANDSRIWRGFYPVDTSALPSNANITAATFNIYGTSFVRTDSTDNGFTLIQTTQADPTDLATADYANVGTTEGATRINVDDWNTSGYNIWTLNATGRSWINKGAGAWTKLGIREGHDLDNHQPDGHTTADAYFADRAGDSEDPYLSVTYTNPPTITSVTDSPDPVPSGNVITFSTDWNDADAGENVKVKICKTDVLSNQNCSGGSWASSTAFTTSDPEAPTYTTQTADIGSQNYWAYVCDDGADCVASGSGTAGTFVVDKPSNVPDVLFR